MLNLLCHVRQEGFAHDVRRRVSCNQHIMLHSCRAFRYSRNSGSIFNRACPLSRQLSRLMKLQSADVSE